MYSEKTITFIHTTKDAPESNEADYAFYLPAAHKNDRPKDTWHTWQVRRVRLIDPLFISKTTVFRWQHSKETTFKLVQSCEPCVNSFRSKYGTRKGARIVTNYVCVHKTKPPARTPLCGSDWIQKWNRTIFKTARLTKQFLHHRHTGSIKKKRKS